MIRSLVPLCLVLTAACATAPRPVDSAAAAAPVIEAERAFAARHQSVSVKQAFLEYSADHGVAIRPRGVVNVKQDLAGWPDNNNAGEIVWWPMFAGIASSGDLGFTTGPAIYGGKMYGGYFTIWEKQPDGSWKWLIDQGTGQTTVPPPSKQGDPVVVVPVSQVAPMDSATAKAELLALDASLGAAMAQDTNALAARLAPDAYLLGMSQHAMHGPAITAGLAQRPAQAAFKTEGGGVSAAGDFGWTYGTATWAENGTQKRGAYMRAWQRRSSGWVIVADNLNPFGRG